MNQNDTLVQYELVSKLLTAQPDENEKFEAFKSLVEDDFKRFADEESSLAEEASALQQLQKVQNHLEEIVAFPHIFTKRSIAVGGGFSSGKSAFVNSFITRPDVQMPVDVTPSTAIPSFVVSNSDVSIKGHSHKGATIDIDSELYRRLTHDFIESFSFNLKELMPYMAVEVPLREGFESICLIDTPGYNPAGGNTDEDKSTAIEFLKDRDALIWMIGLDATGTVPQSDLDFIGDLELGELPFYVVLNKAELKPESELQDILYEVQEILEDEGIECMGISAYSSIRREEYLFEGLSLHNFLREQNQSNGALEAQLKGDIESVFAMYEKAIGEEERDAKGLMGTLNTLNLDLSQFEGVSTDSLNAANRDRLHDRIDYKIDAIKRSQSGTIERLGDQMDQMKQVREKMLESLDEVLWSLRSQSVKADSDLSPPPSDSRIDSSHNLSVDPVKQRQERVFIAKAGRKPSPFEVNDEGETGLHITAALNLPALTKFLLNEGANVNAKDEDVATPLHFAALHNAPEVAEVLLNEGANVNAKDEDGITPLHYAALYDAPEVAKVLLNEGANVNVKDEDGFMPLHAASLSGLSAPETIAVLLHHGANVNDKAENGITPLHYANLSGLSAPETIAVLLHYGANVNDKAEGGITPLHYASLFGLRAPETIAVLLHYGANINDKAEDGLTPLHYASLNGLSASETIAVLLHYGANVNDKDENGLTPLHYAVRRNDQEVVKALLNDGADVTARDNDGLTPLHYAKDISAGTEELLHSPPQAPRRDKASTPEIEKELRKILRGCQKLMKWQRYC